METELESKINMATRDLFNLLYEAGATRADINQIDWIVGGIIGAYNDDTRE